MCSVDCSTSGDPSLPDIWAQRLRPLYNASYNKYWVDEFYGWAVTRRTMDAARAVFALTRKSLTASSMAAPG